MNSVFEFSQNVLFFISLKLVLHDEELSTLKGVLFSSISRYGAAKKNYLQY